MTDAHLLTDFARVNATQIRKDRRKSRITLFLVCVAFGMALAAIATTHAYGRALDAVANPHIEGF